MFVNEIYQGGIRALLDYDNSIFDNFTPPEDPDGVAVDEQLIIDHIIYKYGDAPLMTPDPVVMKYYIGAWSERKKPLWDRFYAAVLKDYNPIENYNRTEKHKTKNTHGHKITTDDDLTHGETVTTDDNVTHGLTTESKISADDSSTYQPDSQISNSGTDYHHIGEGHTGKDERDITETHSGTDLEEIESNISGNIGVTTSQQMLGSEIDLIPRLDLIDFIADDFHNEFNLLVYNY